jgi:hypothetical protein
MLGSAGSYLDGGANAPLQRLALPLMELDFIRRDTWALQRHFVVKRDFLLKELDKLGIIVQWSKFFLYLHVLFIPSESMRRLGLKISISSKWSVGSCIFFLDHRFDVWCSSFLLLQQNPRQPSISGQISAGFLLHLTTAWYS